MFVDKHQIFALSFDGTYVLTMSNAELYSFEMPNFCSNFWFNAKPADLSAENDEQWEVMQV